MPDNPYSVVGFIVMHEHHVEGQLFTLNSSFEWIDERHLHDVSQQSRSKQQKLHLYESIRGTLHIFIRVHVFQ